MEATADEASGPKSEESAKDEAAAPAEDTKATEETPVVADEEEKEEGEVETTPEEMKVDMDPFKEEAEPGEVPEEGEENESTAEKEEGEADETMDEDEGDREEDPKQENDEEEKDEKEDGAMPYSTRRSQQQKEGSEIDRSSVGYRDNVSDRAPEEGSEIGISGRSSAVEVEPAARSTAPAASFLEALTEEERRTRTRFLPEVEGIGGLMKTEVRRDLGLARSIISSSGGVSTLKKARGRKPKVQDEDKMDVEEEDGVAHSEEEKGSEMSGSGRDSSALEFLNKDFPVPSSTFVAPPESVVSSTNGDSGSQDQSKNTVVESISAFNPPRTPESIGPKKKHRMLRWEQRPQDVEVDLNKYRKTVQKTREELHKEEAERQRIEYIGATLRNHCMNHLDSLADECQQLDEDFSSIQMECVKAADLLTSRTRSRGAGKGGFVMRDVLSALKARSAELKDKTTLPCKPEEKEGAPGLGGVSSISFSDWDRATSVTSRPLAEAWVVPGDKVKTPYGKGVVVHVFGPSELNVDEVPLKELRPKSALSGKDGEEKDGVEAMDTSDEKENGQGGAKKNAKPSETTSGVKKIKNGRKTKRSKQVIHEGNPMEKILTYRICVRLGFGLSFFPVGSVVSLEDTSSYSDVMLAARWKKLVETATLVGPIVDIAGMEYATGKREDLDDVSVHGGSKSADSDRMEDADKEESSKQPKENGEAIEVDENAESQKSPQSVVNERNAARKRIFPYGAGLLPTAFGRGALLADLPISELEKGMHKQLFDGDGVTGRKANPGVPAPVREWEDQRYETIQLKAKVLQLRNELYRQRRIRTLNERTLVTYSDRSHRVEKTLKEMKSDLKNLKDRLQEEVTDLGFEEEKAQSLLSAYYKDKEHAGDSMADASPPPKRKKKVTQKEAPVHVPKYTRSRAADTNEGSEDMDNIMGEDVGGVDGNRFEGRSGEDDTGAETSEAETGDEGRRAKRQRLSQ